MTLFYIIAALAVLQGVLALAGGMGACRHLRTFRPPPLRGPRVAVFCPCKGIETGFAENIRSILEQDYPAFHAVFIVESREDPAYGALCGLGVTPRIAGKASGRGQKVHNLIHAVENGAGDAEIFVFCDSDARFPPHWIASLIAPLDDAKTAVATGYRWYAAETGSLPALMRSIWNASVVTALGDHERNFAWGGSMALRREVFESLGIRAAWDGALSDDYAVTGAARAAGRRIVFVPSCLSPSYGDCTWRELLEFTTRQMIITRVYDPGMWRLACFSQTNFNLAFWPALFLSWTHWGAAAACGTLYALAALKGWMRLRAVATVLPEAALSKHRWSYILLVPMSALLYQYNLIGSAFTRVITWRGIRYRLLSPHRTQIQLTEIPK